MKLPNLSYMMSVGEIRYIQAHFESVNARNPDSLVGAFLPLTTRLRCILRGTLFRARVRANPFYYYVLGRTRYYDEVFLDAARGAAKCIVNIGCGSDTRAHRFAPILKENGVATVECDQAQAIEVKQEIAKRAWPADRIDYVSLDLNDEGWPGLMQPLTDHGREPLLVMMEGVSPYVNAAAFEAFLRLLAKKLHPVSVVAYDFKISGVADDFGRSSQSQKLFRLPGDRKAVEDYHRSLGYRLESLELGSDLSRRLAPSAHRIFEEDCLVRLVPSSSPQPTSP